MKSLFCMFLMALLCSAAYAADWISEDIGDDGDVGSTNEAGGVWTITAGGHDIWDAADDFRFIHKKIAGNFEISFEAVSLEAIHDWSKVGPMARQSNAADSQYLFTLARALDGNKYFQERMNTAGGATGSFDVLDTGGFPVWLMLSRIGDDFTGSWSPDGNSWTAIGTTTLELTDPILVGIAVTSHTTGTLTTAVVDNLIATFDATAVEPVGKLPVTWAEIKASR